MTHELTDLQLAILRLLKGDRQEDRTRFFSSVEELCRSLSVRVEEERIIEDIRILEGQGFIVRLSRILSRTEDYVITAEGIKRLTETE